MDKWVSGAELMNKRINASELFAFIRGGLQPYDPIYGRPIASLDDLIKEIHGKSIAQELADANFLAQMLRPIPGLPSAYTEKERPVLSLSSGLPSVIGISDRTGASRILSLDDPLQATIAGIEKSRKCYYRSYLLPESRSEAQIAEARGWHFRLSDILKIPRLRDLFESDSQIIQERAQRGIIDNEKTPARNVAANPPALPCEPGTAWEKIKMTAISDHVLRIKTPKEEKQFTYAELGFADGRNKDNPSNLWTLLLLFCQSQGSIRPSGSKDQLLYKTVSRLNLKLQKIFEIKESFLKGGRYQPREGYVTRITFADQRDQDALAQR
jgi:hypothetical protein